MLLALPLKRPSAGLGVLWAAFVLLLARSACAQPADAPASACGEVVAVGTHGGTTTRYSIASAKGASPGQPRVALVLLPGGGGRLNLDEKGCPRALRGNSLVRSAPHFHAAGFITALVDAPSNYTGDEGLGAFRVATQHANDLGRVVADVRERIGAAVWVVGTSRGAISAVNAAARLSGPALPDGLVLTSPVTVGTASARVAWAAHSVFDLPLEAIRLPVLVIGHAADTCFRSPAKLNGRIVEKTNGVREQVVLVSGGPGGAGASDLSACEGRTPHGFLEQEAEVAAGIARFIRGGSY